MTLARHDMRLSTIIERINRDVNGIEINPAIHSQMERLRIWHIKVQVAGREV